ncbi:MAG: hypothetical protein ACOCYB_10940 [Alkalispirochaeta sp.]
MRSAGGSVEMVIQADIRETRLEREHYDVVHKNSMFTAVSGVR